MTFEGLVNYFKKWKHSKKIYRIILVVTIYLATFETFSEWGFYLDVVSMRPGLVYGYVTNEIVLPLFISTVLSTILYIFEVIFIFCQLFGKQIEIIKFDSLMIIILWFDIIPHLVINSLIAACHEYSVSYFQLFRTIISLGTVLIRFIVAAIEYCSNHDENIDKKTELSRVWPVNIPCNRIMVYRIFTILGFIIQLVLASVLFQFTYIQTYTGHFQFNVPKSLSKSYGKPERYFNTVNIYLSLGLLGKQYNNQYMNIVSLYHLLYSQRYGIICNTQLSFYKRIDSKDGIGFHFHKKFVNLKGQDDINDQCYTLFTKTNLIISQDCKQFSKKYVLTMSYVFHLKYVAPDKYRQFGIIKYQSLRAIYPEKYKPMKIRLEYFASDNGGFLSTTLEKSLNKTWKFYNFDSLYSVKKIWLTGYAKCKTNADEHPMYIKNTFKL